MNIFVERPVFLDETGFNLHTSVNYGYSLVNTKSYSVVRANRGTNQSLMCAVDINGIFPSDIITGAYDSYKFKIFIENELLPCFLNNQRSILIMDNCRFHHRADVLRLLNQSGIEYRFLHAYGPQLNPIEEFLILLKQDIRLSDHAHQCWNRLNLLYAVLLNTMLFLCGLFF
ncbi:hypothetical protein CDIK_2783 [Cucumispora dikerogammari]|nr:hypothetical protein CDIK_2783 [Cucumispora dikerogammari]